MSGLAKNPGDFRDVTSTVRSQILQRQPSHSAQDDGAIVAAANQVDCG
jgi:hypothetical protein